MTTTEVQYIVNEKGEKVAIIIPIEEFEELLEDLHDIAVVAKRRDEPTVSFDELKKRLKSHGLI
ncbi:MAG: type II toxin-antitoxin system Phd/YefM family antitoxin [Candidatus Baldrarchaeia archaeon]